MSSSMVSRKSAAWGWRFEGHHLSLNFTLAGDHATASTPSFLGANPAKVAKGPRAGLRVLAGEEDEARVLLGSLTPPQRRTAVFDAAPTATSSPRMRHKPRRSTRWASQRRSLRRRSVRNWKSSSRFMPARSSRGLPRRAWRGCAWAPSKHSAGPGARARPAALLPRAGPALSHRIRRLTGRWQSCPYRLARFRRGFRTRPAARALRLRIRNGAPPQRQVRRANGG